VEGGPAVCSVVFYVRLVLTRKEEDESCGPLYNGFCCKEVKSGARDFGAKSSFK
jgi:hypothetical protein